MTTALRQHLVLQILVTRALILFVLVRIVEAATNVDSPIGVVLLVIVLGLIDLRRRHELLFWANLGYTAWQTTGVMAAVAIGGEVLMVLANSARIAAYDLFR